MSIHYGRSSRDALIGDSVVVGAKCVVVRGRDPGRLSRPLVDVFDHRVHLKQCVREGSRGLIKDNKCQVICDRHCKQPLLMLLFSRGPVSHNPL